MKTYKTVTEFLDERGWVAKNLLTSNSIDLHKKGETNEENIISISLFDLPKNKDSLIEYLENKINE